MGPVRWPHNGLMTTTQPTTKATAIYCYGPESGGTDNIQGIEYPEWYVYAGDDEAEPVGKSYTCRSYEGAVTLAHKMAKDRRLPLEMEASRA